MGEQQLPEGVERFRPIFQRGPSEAANMAADSNGGYFAVSDLPKLLAQRDREWREGLLSKEALDAADVAIMEDGGKPLPLSEIAIRAALNKAAPDGGGNS